MQEADYKNELSEAEANLYQKAVELLEKAQRNKAEKKLNELLAAHNDFVPALNKKAVIHIYKKEFKQAKSLLNKIMKKDPKYAPAITNLGSIEKELGNNQKAKTMYYKAIEAEEEYGPAYNNLGVIYREEGNYSKSVKYLKKARKFGSLSHGLNSNKVFYKDKGCLFVGFLTIVLIIILYFVLS